MKYHAQSKRLVIEVKTLEGAAMYLRYSLQNIRKTAKLPLTPYKQDRLLTEADYAQKALLDVAELFDIDMGARWGHELDLSDA